MELAKPRLLVTVDTYYPKKDGVLIFLEKVLPSLSNDFEITILAPEFTKKAKEIKGCKLIRLPVSKKIKLASYRSIKFNLKNRKIISDEVKKADIIWSQDLALIGAASIYYARKYKKPVANYIHQITWEHAVDVFDVDQKIKNILSKIIRFIVKYLYNRCDILMVPYQDLEYELNQKEIVTKKIIIPLGVDPKQFSPPESKEDAKKEIGISPDVSVVGYVGRLSKEKDLWTLKEGFIQAKKKFKKCMLLIVGKGPEKKVFKGMKDVKLVGSVKDPSRYYKAMDLFVMPSLTETTSLATLEAMSCGLCVVSTKVGYIKTYIRDRINGFFFPKQNSYVLGKKIDILLRNNTIRKEIGSYARKTTLQKFSWKDTVEKIKRSLLDL